MKLTLPHIVAYVTAVLAWIAALNHDTVYAVLGPEYGKFAVAFIVLCGALVTFIHDVAPVKVTVSTVAKVLPLFALAFMFSGCAQISAFISSPTGQAVIADGIPVAVEVAEGQGVPAAEIKTICANALAADAGTAVTLADLTTEMNKTLSSLNAADKAAISIVEVALNSAINAKLAGNKTVATVQATAAGVFTACVAAAN
jgi:hypothetical protein